MMINDLRKKQQTIFVTELFNFAPRRDRMFARNLAPKSGHLGGSKINIELKQTEKRRKRAPHFYNAHNRALTF